MNTPESPPLLEAAQAAMQHAHAPYSGLLVGAAVLCGDRIITGCNVENASYGLTMCAERTAVYNAISQGFRSIDAVAIVSSGSGPLYPCGACLQVLAEFGKPSMPVYAASAGALKDIVSMTLGDFLPHRFRLDT